MMYETNQADFEGYLTKQSQWLKDWRRRFFILKGSKLFFSKSERARPHGMIDLSTCTTVKSADLKSRKRNSFEISTPETTFLLYADSEKEKDDWIGSAGRAIVRCSSTFQGNTNETGRDDHHYDSDSDYTNSSNNPYFN
eukprot:CAMPEP_0197832912 /NCGR_PEP_ID=MMETSP1437-20131217/16819_1 /TAXON_ID=49252 ORGANISM="Eucampia antarctica, Strain CCMP1452" /NCGR_SAMPLE_ID=MMETSP1437 /ASSEMBLY_ACC=CAM_ASM_001096 /LENGTH=138 /DNA_ID=CAMNT_0043436569 /DNA_START=377 /DNA_END=793 /DNA_ORIENTATION=-